MTVGVGVLGTGVMGAEHVRNLTRVAGAELVAAYDLDPARARAAVAVFDETHRPREPGAADPTRVTDDPYAVIEHPGVDAILVASADATHEEFVRACVAAGKPVLCEKPLTPGTKGSARIVEDERAAGRRLVSVGFMRRYDPGYRALARTLAERELGEPLLLHHLHRNAHGAPHAPLGASLTSSAVHEFDVVRWLCAEEIDEVTVHRPRRSSLVAGEDRDPVLLVLRSASGIVSTVEVFVNAQYGYDVRCELVAERGTRSVDMPPTSTVRSERRRTVGVPEDWRDRFAEAYRAQLQDWIDGVRAGEQRGASAWDGYAATVLSAAGVRALRTGVPVVPELPDRPGFYDPR